MKMFIYSLRKIEPSSIVPFKPDFLLGKRPTNPSMLQKYYLLEFLC